MAMGAEEKSYAIGRNLSPVITPGGSNEENPRERRLPGFADEPDEGAMRGDTFGHVESPGAQDRDCVVHLMGNGRDSPNVVQASSGFDRRIAVRLLGTDDFVAFTKIDSENLDFRRAASAEPHAVALMGDVGGDDGDFIAAEGSCAVGRIDVAVFGRRRLIVVDGSVVLLRELRIDTVHVAIVPEKIDALGDAAVTGLRKITCEGVRIIGERDATRNVHGVAAAGEGRKRITGGDAASTDDFQETLQKILVELVINAKGIRSQPVALSGADIGSEVDDAHRRRVLQITGGRIETTLAGFEPVPDFLKPLLADRGLCSGIVVATRGALLDGRRVGGRLHGGRFAREIATRGCEDGEHKVDGEKISQRNVQSKATGS